MSNRKEREYLKKVTTQLQTSSARPKAPAVIPAKAEPLSKQDNIKLNRMIRKEESAAVFARYPNTPGHNMNF